MNRKQNRVQSKLTHLNASITLPASKSISNRALILKEVYQIKTGNKISLHNLSEADDTHILKSALEGNQTEINIQNAGTCLRFLTAYFAAKVGSDIIINGSERMKERPIKALVDALIQLGAKIDYIDSNGCLPIHIKGQQLKGGNISIDSHQSSQFVSALMMVSPLMSADLKIQLTGETVSKDYIVLTQTMLKEFGFTSHISNNFEWVQTDINVQKTDIESYTIESDWSSAAFFYEAAMVAEEASITLENLRLNSIQGDGKIAEWMLGYGIKSFQEDKHVKLVKTHIKSAALKNISFLDHPDLAPAFICATAGAYLPFCAEGIYSLSFKESNRITALAEGLKKLHYKVVADENNLQHDGIPHTFYRNEIIETHHDHRICMSFAVLSIMLSEVVLSETESVQKSFPNFWEEIKKIGIKRS